MQNTTPELASALNAPERVLGARLAVDWDRDGYNGDGTVDDLTFAGASVGVTQALTTQVPSTAQPVVGAAVAQLHADLEHGHMFGAALLPTVRNVTSSTAATGTGTVSVAAPAGVQPGDIILMWIATPGPVQWYYRPNGANVTWNPLLIRGDYNFDATRLITGRLLVRRIGATNIDAAAEPTTYTFRVQTTQQPWVATCVCVRAGASPGIHALSSKGIDVANPGATFTTLNCTPITTTLDNCLLLSFFAGWAAPGGGVTWTTTDTELADVCSTSGLSYGNATATATSSVGVPRGTYTKSATISAPTEPGVAVTVALAPMTAGDDTQNAAWTFSELNSQALYAGKLRSGRPVTLDIITATSTGPQDVRVFTGRTLTVDVSARARRARMVAQDNRELMRRNVVNGTFPPTVMAESPFITSVEGLPNYPGLEATWLVSKLITYSQESTDPVITPNDGPRAGVGFFASPPPRPGTILHVPCHGSLQAFEGAVDYSFTDNGLGSRTRCTFDLGPWVGATAPAPFGGSISAKWLCNNQALPWGQFGGSAGRLELYTRKTVVGSGTVFFSVVGDDTPNLRFAQLSVDTGGNLILQLAINGGISRIINGPTLPADTAWHAVGVHWDASTGVATFRVDVGVTNVNFTTFVGTNTANYDFVNGLLQVTDGAQVAELQAAGGMQLDASSGGDIVLATDPFMWDNFTPTAFIDRSVNILDGTVPFDETQDVWQALTELADAEFAAVYFDGRGRPHYRTRYSDVTATGQTVQRTLTTLNSLRELDYASGAPQLANVITVPYTPIATSLNAQVWKPSAAIRIPASSSVVFTVALPGVLMPGGGTTFSLGNANTKPDGSGTVVSTGLGMGVTPSGSKMGISLSNANAFDVWTVDNTGNTNVTVTSSYLTSGTTTTIDPLRDDESARRYDSQSIVNGVAESKWRQRADSATTIAQLLLADLAFPRPVLTNVKIVGDPRLEIGDLVRIVDPDGLGLDGNYRITGINPTYSATEGFTQSISARFAGCGVAIWDVSSWDDCSVWGA